MIKVLVLLGTRPEAVKLAPVIQALERHPAEFSCTVVSSSQHTDLLRPFVRDFGLRIDRDLAVMREGQDLAGVFSRVLLSLADVLREVTPDIVLVQGDTTTAVAGALASFYAGVPVGHVEAGLRTDNRLSPFPEEMNRRLITQIADLHFAATPGNAARLRTEGIDGSRVLVTGNTVIDALTRVLEKGQPSQALRLLLEQLGDSRFIVLTTHRRENFGEVMAGHLRVLRRFIERHPGSALVLPVHPNPAVRAAVDREFSGVERLFCIPPLEYADFQLLLSRAWLIASDSGGIQEEAPTIGKPLLVLRDTTERPEVLECGIGRLVGHDAQVLDRMLEEAWTDREWEVLAARKTNPFGDGNAAARIVEGVRRFFESRVAARSRQTA